MANWFVKWQYQGPHRVISQSELMTEKEARDKAEFESEINHAHSVELYQVVLVAKWGPIQQVPDRKDSSYNGSDD